LQAVTKTFQSSVKLSPADGYYGTNTQTALAKALGTAAPAPCYTSVGGKQTGACTPTAKPKPAPVVTCASGTVADVVTGKCVAPCSDGSSPQNGVCPVTPPAATGTVQASNGPLVAGVLIAVLGVGAVTYAVQHKKHGARRR